MSVIFLLITASTFVAGVFLVAFIWAVRRGQFDDDLSPAVRILNDYSPPAAASAGPRSPLPERAANTPNETILTPNPSPRERGAIQ
ncbi:MAG: cbb3-type cytochrome oxidase assembly protein CcoS [Flavobacteriales bacterium]|nr:cbb3-type cytochrome oxidase assembly protein CcoS [Flavobacteriales bacterium]